MQPVALQLRLLCMHGWNAADETHWKVSREWSTLHTEETRKPLKGLSDWGSSQKFMRDAHALQYCRVQWTVGSTGNKHMPAGVP